MRKNWKLLTLAALSMIVFLPEVLLACPVCYGSADAPMNKGMNNAIWVLVGIIGFVQLGFVALFWSFWRRSKQLQRFREQFHVVKGSSLEGSS